jgi:hypothetical protein
VSVRVGNGDYHLSRRAAQLHDGCAPRASSLRAADMRSMHAIVASLGGRSPRRKQLSGRWHASQTSWTFRQWEVD